MKHVSKRKLSLERVMMLQKGSSTSESEFSSGRSLSPRVAPYLSLTVSLFSPFMVQFITAISETHAHEFHLASQFLSSSRLNFAPLLSMVLVLLCGTSSRRLRSRDAEEAAYGVVSEERA